MSKAIEKIKAKIKELEEYFDGDLHLCIPLIQLGVLMQMLIDYKEKGIEPTDYQWCLKDEYGSIDDYF